MENGGGGAKILQKIMAPPLSVIKIVKYCGVGGGESLLVLKSYKDNGAPSPCHQDSYILWRLGRGGGAMGGAKILQMIMGPLSLSL